MLQDRTGSLLIRQDPSSGPRGGKDSIHLYRDGGFTKQDLAALVQGYQEAWSGLNGRDVSYRFACIWIGVMAVAGVLQRGRGQKWKSDRDRASTTDMSCRVQGL